MTLTGSETKRQLLEIASKAGISEANDKMKNASLIDLIKGHEDYEEEYIPSVNEIDEDEVPGEVKDPNGVVMIKETSKLQDIAEDNERMYKAIVVDHDNTQSIEDEDENRMFSASWGNMVCPVRLERVLTNGHETWISVGMTKHMKTLRIPESVKGKSSTRPVITRMKQRFTITPVPDGITEEGLKELKAKAKLG